MSVSRLSTGLGEAPLFDGFRLDLAGGRTTAILGPSGVGKSTLLRIIAGLPLQGILVDGPLGAQADDGMATAGRVAWMAQNDLLLPWATVADNVRLGARLRGDPGGGDEKRVRALLAAVGLTEQARQRPGALSGGMRQRVALARTLFEDRPVVLMDEPFAALDVPLRLRLGDLAARLLAGRTVVLVTHDPLEALRLADTVLVLGGPPGRIIERIEPEGPPPRPPGTADLTALQARLLEALASGTAP